MLLCRICWSLIFSPTCCWNIYESLQKGMFLHKCLVFHMRPCFWILGMKSLEGSWESRVINSTDPGAEVRQGAPQEKRCRCFNIQLRLEKSRWKSPLHFYLNRWIFKYDYAKDNGMPKDQKFMDVGKVEDGCLQWVLIIETLKGITLLTQQSSTENKMNQTLHLYFMHSLFKNKPGVHFPGSFLERTSIIFP